MVSFKHFESTIESADECGTNLGASTANLSLRSIYVVVNTNLAACGGGIGWTLLEYMYTRKFSILGFCSGIISGLVGITPAAGFGAFICSYNSYVFREFHVSRGLCVMKLDVCSCESHR